MSYPSIKTIIKNRSSDINSAKKSDLEEILWSAFKIDLKDGITWLKQFAEDVKSQKKRIMRTENPNSPLGKQLIRLLGTDIARAICEKKFGVAFGFYNCCNPVAALSRKELNINPLEQILLQNGTLASADC